MAYNRKEIRTRSTAKVNQTAFGKDKVVKPHIPVDPAGYWNPSNWGKPVTIPSNTITGRGINQPLIGIDDLGTVKPILPGQPVIQFPGNKVTEYPMSYFDVEADDDMITQFKNGGFIVEDISKAQDGKQKDDDFKKRLLKRYPGMQKVYGAEGENLNIIRDPEYRATDYGYGGIEFIYPGTGLVTYSDDYQYQSPTPDKYTAVYNPKNANRRDVFLDLTHGMRDDPEYMKLLNRFSEATQKGKGEEMDYFYNQDAETDPSFVLDGRTKWNENYIDSQLRAQLASKGLGKFADGAKDYRKERKYNSPEMKKAAKDIYNYLKNPEKNYLEAELTPEQIKEYQTGGYVVEYVDSDSTASGLAKAELGDEVFTYPGRKDSYYKRDSRTGEWYISNPSTKNQYTKIEDPTGSRSKELTSKATVYQPAPQQAPGQNIFTDPAFMSSQQLQQKAMSTGPTVEGTKWLEMAAAQKKNEEAKRAYEQQQAEQARYNRASGASSSATNAPIYQNQQTAPVDKPLPYVGTGSNNEGALISQAQRDQINREVAQSSAVNTALSRDRNIIEQISGRSLTDQDLYDRSGNYNPRLAQYSSPEWQQKIEGQRFKNFQDWEQQEYDKASWLDKTKNFASALLTDAPLTIGNLVEGKGPLMYQSALLRGDEAGQPQLQQYARQATNADDYWLNDWVNYVNPFDAFADAGAQASQGDYGSALFNAATALPIFKGAKLLGTAAKNTKLANQISHGLHAGLETPLLRTALRPSTIDNALLQSGESALQKSLLDLTPGKALQAYSTVALPGAARQYYNDPTAGNFANLGLLAAGTPQVYQGAAALGEASLYARPYARTVANIAKGEAPLSLESFKRKDLFRFTPEAEFQKYADDFAAASRGEKELSLTRGKFASTVDNPDKLMYTASKEPSYFFRSPQTAGSAKSYNLAEQYAKVESKIAQGKPLSKYEQGIKVAGERSILPKAQFEEDLASGAYAELNLSDDMINNIRKVAERPQDYWKQDWYINNPELQKIIPGPKFTNKAEYLLPKPPRPSDYRLVTNAGDAVSSMETSLATTLRRAAAEGAAERELARQEGKILTAKGTSKIEAEDENKELPNKYQTGGTSNSPVFEGELDEERIKELERQGFRIEPITERKKIDLKLPEQNETFKKNNFSPYAFVTAFNENDINNLLLGVGVSGMFDTPLKQLRAGLDINALNITGFDKKGIMYNDFNVQAPSLKLNYNIPYTIKKKR
jgi:hypothetical protein